MGNNSISMIGMTFNRLKVLSGGGKSKKGELLWKCTCSCGNQITICGSDIRSGHTKSCGCIRKERNNGTKHNRCYTPEYLAWRNMKSRCYNPKGTSYKDYGGRGIEVCNSWLKSFDVFFSDMGTKPSKAHSLDRIDNEGNYCKANCRWASTEQQSNNKRTTKVYTVVGVGEGTITQLSNLIGINPTTVTCRMGKGYSLKKALTTKIRGK